MGTFRHQFRKVYNRCSQLYTKVLHLGYNNINHNYLESKPLCSVIKEENIIMASQLKFDGHYALSVKRANGVLTTLVLYINPSPLHYFNLQFSFGLAWKTFPATEKVSNEISPDKFYIIEHIQGFKIVVRTKKWAKLSKDGKLTLKRGQALVSKSNLSRSIYQVSR